MMAWVVKLEKRKLYSIEKDKNKAVANGFFLNIDGVKILEAVDKEFVQYNFRWA